MACASHTRGMCMAWAGDRVDGGAQMRLVALSWLGSPCAMATRLSESTVSSLPREIPRCLRALADCLAEQAWTAVRWVEGVSRGGGVRAQFVRFPSASIPQRPRARAKACSHHSKRCACVACTWMCMYGGGVTGDVAQPKGGCPLVRAAGLAGRGAFPRGGSGGT